MIVSRSDRRVQDCEPRTRLRLSVAKLGGSCIEPSLQQRENRSICSHTVVLKRGEVACGAVAVICFEWLQRPENVVAGHIKWTGYRTGSKPTIRIEHHKTGAVIGHPLESGVR
jgi:hypothetical protein